MQFIAQDFAPTDEPDEDTNSSICSPATVGSAGGDGHAPGTADDSPSQMPPTTNSEGITMANVSSAFQQRMGGAFARLSTTWTNANNTIRRTIQMQTNDADGSQTDGQQQSWSCDECERRVRALDREDLKPHFSVCDRPDIVEIGSASCRERVCQYG